MKKLTCLLVLVMLVNGCATVGTNTFNYTKPQFQKIDNSMIIEEPFEKVWDKLVEKLSQSFFIINNINKDSRIINVSFATNEPKQYIDCGDTVRTFEKGKQKETYSYNVAETSQYRTSRGTFGVRLLEDVWKRKTSLEGRINIYVAPIDKNSTKVTVNVRYILTVKASGVAYQLHPYNNVILSSNLLGGAVSSLGFTTNQDNKENWGTIENPTYVTCHSTSKLENKILDMIRK